MAAIEGVTKFFYWILLPFALLASVVFRYNALSAIYLLFFLGIPYSPKLTPSTIGSWIACTIVMVILSGVFVLGHIVFQIVLSAKSPYGSLLGQYCSTAESIARYVGFQRYNHMDVGNIFRLLLPDIVILVLSTICLVLIRKTANHYRQASQTQQQQQDISPSETQDYTKLLNTAILCLTVLFMALTGIAYPSVLSFLYLFVFLILAFMWAFNLKILAPSVTALRACLSVLTGLHLLMLYLYQMSFMQHYIVSSSIYARLFGITPIIKTDCTAPYALLLFPNTKWSVFVNVAFLFVLHWLLAIGVQMYFKDSKPLVVSEEHTNYEAIESPSTSPKSSTTPREDGLEEMDGSPQKKKFLQKVSDQLLEVKLYSFYVVALIVMMVWSVTYHSWLTFVLLIWSCILWMLPQRSWATLLCSPFLSLYAVVLVLMQFVYSLDLNESELPTVINNTGSVLYLSAFGLRHYDYPCLPLGAQILYLCAFLLVFHQFIYIRKHGGKQGHISGESDQETWTDQMVAKLKELLCRYWIAVVVSFHLAIGTEGYPTGIKVIYMGFFLLNMTTYILSWTFWRKSLTLYWFVLVFYTMIVLCAIYTYQFQSFPDYWKSFTHFNDSQLADLGLVQYDTAGDLLVRILLPAIFLLCIILQLNYFNKRFLELTGKPQRISSPSGSHHESEVEQEDIEMDELNREEDKKRSWLSKKLRQLGKFIIKAFVELYSFILRALEFHSWRLVFITVFVAAAYQVSVVSACLVIFWVCFLPARRLHIALYMITLIYVALFILGTMFYQLQFISYEPQLYYHCTFLSRGYVVRSTKYLLDWIGFRKMASTSSAFFYHVQGYLSIVIMIALERTVSRGQEWRRLWRNEPMPVITAFYPSVTHKEVDRSLLDCCKYFLNYFFYKFGVECCFTMTVITVWVRMDIYATLYSLLLIICMSLKTRLVLSRYWRFYMILLIVLLVGQYLICLGMPPSWCVGNTYPWNDLGNSTTGSRLIRWLYLPDYIVVPNATSLIADFFQLLFFTSQLFVFERERNVWLKFGGDNRYLTGADLDKVTIHSNPKKSFMHRKSRTLLDQLKAFVFKYMIWVTMAVVFIAGTSRISLFCLGYLISFFYLLSRQQHLIMGRLSRLLKIWNIIMGYNLAVIALKASLQVASCVYIETLRSKACAFVQLMSLVCSYPKAYRLAVPSVSNPSTCELSYVNAGLTSDFICFIFLLIQKRIFTSYYFLHVANDMRAAMQLASRGAELFREKLIEEVKERERVEEENLSFVKNSMMKIKQKYATMQKGMKSINTHIGAIMSGDYYMFETDDDRDDLSVHSDEIMDPVKMMHKAGTVGIDKALKEREMDKKKVEDEVIHDLTESKDHHLPKHKDHVEDEQGSSGGKDVVDSHEKEQPDREEGHGSDNDDEEEEKKEEKSFFQKTKSALKFVWELCLSGVDYLTLKLNESNVNYRNIVLQLNAERDQLTKELCKQEPRSSMSDIAIVVEESEQESKISTPSRSKGSDEEYVELKPIEFDKDQHRLLRLFYALWYSIIARTDLVCYFLIILNLMLDASILNLVLPLSVFLWACFCVPRPYKDYWMFVLIYLQVVIVLKFIFQFELFPWNSEATTNLNKDNPFFPPRIIGIEQSSSWMVMDLLQLLAVFFHISVIKVYGLWNRSDRLQEEESKEEEEDPAASEPASSPSKSEVASTSQNDNVQNIEEVEPQHSVKGGEKKKEEKKPFLKKLGGFLTSPIRFYSSVLNQRFSAVTDVYIYMFLCDVVDFVIIIFGYWAFGAYSTQQTNVVSNLQSNQVPTGFLVMLLIQFSMMFIDRALYLRKNLLGKMLFQIILVIGIHVWLFFILPAINQRPFSQNHVAQTWYFFKALYFLLSAYQIRAGYPNRVCGNFLTKSYGTVNLFLYKGYRLIPFLAELTAIMNWMYTETSMAVGEWMKLWSIHAEIFELKCWRVFNAEYPSPRGEAKKTWLKYIIGGSLVFILLFIIWFPLLLMNIVMTIAGLPNNPVQVDVKISLGTFEPLFQVAADQSQITTMTSAEFNTFAKQFANIPAAASFLTGFGSNQVVNVKIDGQSKTSWMISPPQKVLLMSRLHKNNTNPVQLTFDWTLLKDTSKTSVSTATGFNVILLKANSKERNYLYEQLNRNTSVTYAMISHLYPKYIYSAATSSKAPAASSLYTGLPINKNFSDVNLALKYSPNDSSISWWSVFEKSDSLQAQIPMVILSDKVSPSSLSFLVNYGIIGLYVSVVLVVGRVVRSAFGGQTSTIMFVDLPNVDRILQLCNDIFLAREEHEFELEEDLMAKLTFLYRSPELLIKWTRPKQD